VTGFVGPNGAGKSTTLRMALGLVRPDSGQITVWGRRYADLASPSRDVGVVLEAVGAYPGIRGRDHLRAAAIAGGITSGRVDDVLAAVGLETAAGRRVRTYSLGMRQRLAIAAALLGRPRLLILDEPTNGLDPAGIRWLRDLLRSNARDGCAVLISSHQLSELEQMVDHVIVIDHGRLVAEGRPEKIAGRTSLAVRVRCADPQRLARILREQGLTVQSPTPDVVVATGAGPETIGEIALGGRVAIYEMGVVTDSLETSILKLLGTPGQFPADSEQEV
jgi:ABC-2 type transport system ATP-binding protein